MSALPIILTTAGLAALVNAKNTGVSNVVIASIGVSATQAAITAATTAIPNEIKRITGVAGQVVADDTFYVSAPDQSGDTYTVRTVALYLDNGVLLAAYSQAAPLLEKAGSALAVLEAAVKLAAPLASGLAFTGGGWQNPPASETVEGVLRLATVAEAVAGTNPTRAITPFTLSAVVGGFLASLAGKASIGHTHSAADTVAGVFDLARIPDLAIAKITGLVAALAGKADNGHTHDAGQTVSGIFNIARIPDLAMEKITGLVAALAGKAAAAHTHNAADTVAGTFDAARIPDLALAKITGLVNALAAKAGLNTDVRFNSVRVGSGNGLVYSDGDNLVLTSGVPGAEKYVRFGADGTVQNLSGTFFSGAYAHWHSGNFNPADKANAIHSHDWAQVTGRPVWTDAAAASVTTGYKAFVASDRSIPNGTDSAGHAAIEIRGSGTGAAFLAFHRPGQFASFFGLDIDNQWKVGGWSAGAVAYRMWHEGVLAPATAGDAAGGVAVDRFITPAALWSFARSMGASGYAVIPGTGLMIQWGVNSSTIAEGFVDAMLPVAFGGGCLVALALPRNPTGVIAADFYMQIGGKFLDRISFFANRANSGAGNMPGFEWLALGAIAGNPDAAYSGTAGAGSGGGGTPGSGGGGEVLEP